MSRKNISARLRFEVFKRDRFACQYCGAKAPDVALHIDHIFPVSDGGPNVPANFITSCQDCNLGKGVGSSGSNHVQMVAAAQRICDRLERRFKREYRPECAFPLVLRNLEMADTCIPCHLDRYETWANYQISSLHAEIDHPAFTYEAIVEGCHAYIQGAENLAASR